MELSAAPWILERIEQCAIEKFIDVQKVQGQL